MIENVLLGRILRGAFVLAGLLLCVGMAGAVLGALGVGLSDSASAIRKTAVAAGAVALAVARLGLVLAGSASAAVLLVLFTPGAMLQKWTRPRD